MYLLLSGEGKTDMGVCYPAQEQCEGEQFKAGAMAVIVDQQVELSQGYEFSHLNHERVGFVHKSALEKNNLITLDKPAGLPKRLRGKKTAPETKYYFESARVLSILAKQKANEINDTVIAVIFHDSDGTASAGRGDWQTKWNSMKEGFLAEGYDLLGVPMLAKPKSEAWLLCAVKDNPYQHCAQLENITGNDKGQAPLKEQLTEALNGDSSVETINKMLRDKRIDIEKIEMDSFTAFRDALDSVVKNAMSQK